MIVNGFYEWQHIERNKIKYEIGFDDNLFALAGLYEHSESGSTYTIVTTEAEGVMREIHNTKLRMPFALKNRKNMDAWLSGDIPINATAIVDAFQALVCARLRVTFVSLFFSRMRDAGIDAAVVIANVRRLLDRMPDSATRIIVGSIRCRDQVVDSLASGADIVTVPPKVFFKGLSNPTTRAFVAEMSSFARCTPTGKDT